MRRDLNLPKNGFYAMNISAQRRESKTSAQNSSTPRISPYILLALTFKCTFKFPVFAEEILRWVFLTLDVL